MFLDQIADISELNGKIIAKVEVDSQNSKLPDDCREQQSNIVFYCYDGDVFCMSHRQDCCENVVLEDIDGDIHRLEGRMIVNAYESHQSSEDEDFESRTWTFYRIIGEREILCLRWLGESNGYYSEKVDFFRI